MRWYKPCARAFSKRGFRSDIVYEMATRIRRDHIERFDEHAAHFRGVGCRTAEAYQEWCRDNGLPTDKRKPLSSRRRELILYSRLQGDAAMRGAWRFDRHPEEVLRELASGKSDKSGDLRETLSRHPYLRFVEPLFNGIRNHKQVREAFLQLLLHTHRAADMRHTGMILARMGTAGNGNSLPEALLALAHRHANWRRPLADWKPQARGGERQFAELARYLLCDWHVPGFLDVAWYSGTTGTAREAQDWFIQIGTGTRSQILTTPFVLTKRMVHAAMNDVPATCTVTEGWRWAQVLSMGGTARQAQAIVATPLGESFAEETFWETVVRFVVDNPLLDPAQIGHLVDYLRHERLTTRREYNGANRLPEGFTMKGRTVAALMERVEVWHRALQHAQTTRHVAEKWDACGIGGLACEEATSTGMVQWRVTELTTAKSLTQEGAAMCHCVATYAGSCARGAVSVWSLTVQAVALGEPERVMTIAVNNNRHIGEARGRRNALPSATGEYGAPLGKIEATLLLRGRRVVQRWARAQVLTLPLYLSDGA